MLFHRFVYVVDPVVADLNVGIELDKIRAAREAVDVPDAEKIKVQVAIEMVAWCVDDVVVGTKLSQF